MRLTMKPGVLRAVTGTLPQALARVPMASATSGRVCRPVTTSTSFISGTGLKKCMPTSRPGRCSPLAMAVMLIDEVLLASTASSLSSASSCWNRPRLAASCSTMASTTSLADAACCRLATGVMRASVASTASSLSRPLATKPASSVISLALAWFAAPSRASNRNTGWPACAATWAMPLPMMPAPITSTGTCFRSMGMVDRLGQ